MTKFICPGRAGPVFRHDQINYEMMIILRGAVAWRGGGQCGGGGIEVRVCEVVKC